jgi:FdhE protein
MNQKTASLYLTLSAAACSRYIKTRDSRKGGVDVQLEVENLLTIHLDMLATREGFERGK